MKRIALLLTFCLAAAAAAQQTTDTTGTTGTTATTGTKKPADSPLVRAAKASGGTRKMPKKVLTNADVKKSKGNLAVVSSKSDASASKTPADAAPQKGPIEQHEALLRAQDKAAERVKTAEKKVADLEKEARRLEEAYYAENDPNYRDTVIAARFHQTKQQLDGARKDLADARDAQTKLNDAKTP